MSPDTGRQCNTAKRAEAKGHAEAPAGAGAEGAGATAAVHSVGARQGVGADSVKRRHAQSWQRRQQPGWLEMGRQAALPTLESAGTLSSANMAPPAILLAAVSESALSPAGRIMTVRLKRYNSKQHHSKSDTAGHVFQWCRCSRARCACRRSQALTGAPTPRCQLEIRAAAASCGRWGAGAGVAAVAEAASIGALPLASPLAVEAHPQQWPALGSAAVFKPTLPSLLNFRTAVM